MNSFLEDSMLSSIKVKGCQKDKEVKFGEAGGGGDEDQNDSHQFNPLNQIAKNISYQTRQAESEVEDNSNNGEMNNENDSKLKKHSHVFLSSDRQPQIHEKYLRQYTKEYGYLSDSNDDIQHEERSLRLCQFLLLLDNSPSNLFRGLNEIQVKRTDTQQLLMYSNIAEIKKKLSNSEKLEEIDKNTSVILDSYTINNVEGDQQNKSNFNIQSNRLILEDWQQFNMQTQDKPPKFMNKTHSILRSLSFNEKDLQQDKSNKKFIRSNSYEIQRSLTSKGLFQQKQTLRVFINKFIKEKRKCLQDNKNKKEVFFKLKSMRELDYSLTENKKQIRRVSQFKLQVKFFIQTNQFNLFKNTSPICSSSLFWDNLK